MRFTTGFSVVISAGLIGCGGGGSSGANVTPSASLQGTPASTVAPDIATYDYSLDPGLERSRCGCANR